MEFRNPQVPEGINVSRHSPLYEFFLLGLGALLLFAALGFASLFLGSLLGRYAPVVWENAVAGVVIEGRLTKGRAGAEADVDSARLREELQALADRLAGHMALPAGLTVKAHYLDSDEVNAFATVGGHIFIARGLIERMPHENALAMVVAHEIAHVAHRDPAAALGGVVLLEVLAALVTTSGSQVPEELILGPNALLLSSFSREVEREADAAALEALAGLYGHVAEASTFFEAVLGLPQPPELLSSHPLTQERIDEIGETARERDWPLRGETTPLTPALARLAGGG